LSIKFLDEQLDEVESFSKVQSLRGKISAAKRNQRSTSVEEKPTTVAKSSTTVEPPLKKTQPIRREEKREEEKREELIATSIPSTNIYSKFDKLENDLLSEQSWIESVAMKEKRTISEVTSLVQGWILHLKTQGEDYVSMRNAKSWCSNWIAKQPHAPKSNQLTPEQMDANTLAVLKDWGLK
jgi:hypothetical protein